jgi:hypothetical protein
MAEKNINTSTTLRQPTKPQDVLEKEMATAQRKLGKDIEMVDLMIPEAYKGYFTNPAKFSVNGVAVEIPLGKTVKVPKPHYLHAQRLMKGAVLTKNQKRLSPEEIYND